MVIKTPIFRKVSFFSLAVLLGLGALTLTYAATYTAGPYCYLGRTTYATSFSSQAQANAKMAQQMAADPNSAPGECPPGTPPVTPGAP